MAIRHQHKVGYLISFTFLLIFSFSEPHSLNLRPPLSSVTSKTALPNILKIASKNCKFSKDWWEIWIIGRDCTKTKCEGWKSISIYIWVKLVIVYLILNFHLIPMENMGWMWCLFNDIPPICESRDKLFVSEPFTFSNISSFVIIQIRCISITLSICTWFLTFSILTIVFDDMDF